MEPHIKIKGQQPLHGTIPVMGAKNEALKTIIAATLFSEPVTITNVPDIQDIHRAFEIIDAMGGSVQYNRETHTVIINTTFDTIEIPEDLATKIRASVVFLGPMVAKYKEVILPLPGGDTIGKRPINFFLDAIEQLGATVKETEKGYHVKADQLVGTTIIFPTISVTATETLMMAGSLAKGITTLHNCPLEPEIVALAEKLNSCGANIQGAGTHTITIEGVEELKQTTPWETIPDRIEAMTFATMAVATKSELTITNCNPTHLQVPLWKLEQIGANIETTKDSIIVKKSDAAYKAIEFKTHEYPGYSTDMQSQLAILLTQCEGMSLIHETIFDGRLHYLETLNSFGANTILFDPHRAAIIGPTPLKGKIVRSPDIRGGIAFIIAGLIAEGETEIQNIYQIQRGAERIIERLQAVGANITLHSS